MDDNPYTPPTAPAGGVENPTMRYRVFRAKTVSFKLTGEASREDVRREVQRAIEAEIGAENVVSIVEHASALETFHIVVWYRVLPRKQ